MKYRNLKQLAALVLVLALLLSLTGIAEDPATKSNRANTETVETVEKVNDLPAELTLGKKENYVIDAKKLSKKKVAFTSSAPKIASVSDEGVIKAKKEGMATITCSRGEKVLATCNVTVLAAPKKVTLNEKKLTLDVGKTAQLKATLPQKTASYAMTWKSSNKNIATVDSNGVVKAVAPGTAKITVTTFNNKNATCEVKVSSQSQDGVAIDETNFPDGVFRKYVRKFDLDGDGVLSVKERSKVKEIQWPDKKTASLKGIEWFSDLERLDCYGTQITSLDVSHNTALKELKCSSTQLTSLDVSHNTALTTLDCYYNHLTSLDVSKNTALADLECGANQLTSLDVSHNTALKSLSCWRNQLTSLKVSKDTALTYLQCSENQLTSLDISHNTALTYLQCSENQLTSLDVSHNTALAGLSCSGNQLTSLNVSRNTALQSLSCYENKLTNLDVSHNTALTSLFCYENQLTKLDVSYNTALTELFCSENKLKNLIVSKNKALFRLYCNNNHLTSLKVSGAKVLRYLHCFNNQLVSLDLKNNVELVDVVNNGKCQENEGIKRYSSFNQELIVDSNVTLVLK